jgi:hypothetical protein
MPLKKFVIVDKKKHREKAKEKFMNFLDDLDPNNRIITPNLFKAS